jgi:hypothetical protein
MSNNRMLALVAILAGGLMVGACGESITGPAADGSSLRDPGATTVDPAPLLPNDALVNDPKGSDHRDAYDEEVER